MNPTSIQENVGSIPGFDQWVGIRHCRELCCRSWVLLRSHVAVAVVQASSYSSDLMIWSLAWEWEFPYALCVALKEKKAKTQTKTQLSFLLFFFFFFFFFLGPPLQHTAAPRPGVKSELQLLATATAIAIWDPSCICDLHHSSWQCQILNPLSEARDGTHNLMDIHQIPYHWATWHELPLLLINQLPENSDLSALPLFFLQIPSPQCPSVLKISSELFFACFHSCVS